MQCQETVLLTSSLISLLGSTVILVCLVSISLPHLFTGNLLADNLAFMETFLQEELVKYDIDIDIRQYRDVAMIVLYTTSSITILESVLLILGIKTRVGPLPLQSTVKTTEFIIHRRTCCSYRG